MRILFDHQVFSWQTYGGISRYFVAQIQGLQTLGHEPLLPTHFYSENVYLRQLPDFQRNSSSRFNFKGKKFLQNYGGRSASKRAIRQMAPEVFHPTYFDPYFLDTCSKQGIPFVITVHDMIHEKYGHGQKGLFSLDAKVVANKRHLAEKAAAIISVSEHTRQDLLHFYPHLNPDKIVVAHHGNALVAPEPDDKTPEIQVAPYLLFVGQRKGYKNFQWMLEQLAPLLQTEPALQLWCVGGGALDESEQAYINRLRISQQVQYHAISSDSALARVYQQAQCFIFPSQYEGFGMPVLEAFACACPVILHRASSLPEVGGDAALYFDMKTEGSLENALKQVLHDSSERKKYIERGLERVKQFTWARSVEKHLAVYEGLRNIEGLRR